MCIRRETREKARRSLAFSRVSKPHTHITHMLRQCTSIVYLSGKIREASSHNLKKFRDILKRCTNAKKSNVEVPLTEFYEYFKNINSSDEEY